MVRTSFICFFICISFVDYILAFHISFVNIFSTLLILFIINIVLPAQQSDYLKHLPTLLTQLRFIINSYIYKTVYYITAYTLNHQLIYYITGLCTTLWAYTYILYFFCIKKHRLSRYSYMLNRYNYILDNIHKTPVTGVYYKTSDLI